MNACFTHVVGSSRNIMGGLFTSSNAMESRFCSPPDNRWPIVSAVLVSRNRSSISSIYEIRIYIFIQYIIAIHQKVPLHSYQLDLGPCQALGRPIYSWPHVQSTSAGTATAALYNATFSEKLACHAFDH